MFIDGYGTCSIKLTSEVIDFMKKLDIPHDNFNIKVSDLYNILSDKDKVQEFISKLQMKAFW